ncbi:MAG: malate dehydrogenase [Candidatus Caenarcaniphilales bacterium]|nr:malate dehydrogenase [Candidatus Caenarcaniphilales bacterium]
MSILKQPKVTVIGAGNVGATTAQRITEKNIADVVLIDVAAGIATGKALDLSEAAPVEYHDRRIIGGGNYEDTKDSDVVVITAGIARKPGMSRDDLLKTNANIVGSCAKEALKQSPNAIFVIVSNPLDVMTYLAKDITKLPANKVVGMAGVLDSARMRFFIAEALNVSVQDVTAFVLGGHGDSMVPLARYSSVAGIPLTDLLPSDKIESINERTRKGGIEIVNHLQTGSAFYAPGSSTAEMVESIVRDKKRVLPSCCYLDGQYGLKDIYVGVPAKLGSNGVEEIFEIKLTDQELAELQKSAADVRSNIDKLVSLTS